MRCRYIQTFFLLIYLIIIWPVQLKTALLGCPKLNNPSHGGFICADAIKRENQTKSSYEVRVCAPNCRTGYTANLNNTIVFCTSNSKIWRLLPDDYSINDLECIPTVNILYFIVVTTGKTHYTPCLFRYHNNEDRLQVRIQDFIEGKIPADLDPSYPRLLEKSDNKDTVENFNTDQHSDINTIKRKETTNESTSLNQNLSSNNSSLTKTDDRLDYYSFKEKIPFEDSDNSVSVEKTAPSSHSKHIDDVVNDSNQTQEKSHQYNTTNDENNKSLLDSNVSNSTKMYNHDQNVPQDQNTVDKQFNPGLFQSPLSALKFLIDTVASPKNNTKISNSERIHSYYSEQTTTTQTPLMVLPVQPPPIINHNIYQYTVPSQNEWNNLESMFVDTPQTTKYSYTKPSDEVVDENSFPLFDLPTENTHTRTIENNKWIPKLQPSQLNIPPVEIDMTRFEKNDPVLLTPSPTRQKVRKEIVNSTKRNSNIHTNNKINNQANNKGFLARVKPSGNIKKNIKPRVMATKKNHPIKRVHYVDLINKLKDGTIMTMNTRQRTKLVEYIKNNTKLTRKSYCSNFYPICKITPVKNKKRYIKNSKRKTNDGRFWTFPVT